MSTARILESLATKPYSSAPDQYNGTIGEFFERYCRPNLISISDMKLLHEHLLRYTEGKNNILYLRQVSDLERDRSIGIPKAGHLVGDRRIEGSDNSPAWALHSMAVSSLVPSYDTFEDWMMNRLPCFIFSTKHSVKTNLNAFNWHAAHIIDAKDGDTNYVNWDEKELKRRFLRNVHPLNIALTPKPEWRMHGGDRGLLGYFVNQYKLRYGTLWDEFLAALNQTFSEENAWDAGHSFAYGTTMPTLVPTVRPSIQVAPMNETFGAYDTDPRTSSFKGQRVLVWHATRLSFSNKAYEALKADSSIEAIIIAIRPTEASKARGNESGHYYLSREKALQVFKEKSSNASWAKAGVWHSPEPPQIYKVYFHKS